MQDVLSYLEKNQRGVLKNTAPPPSRDMVKDFQVVIKVASFLRNPVSNENLTKISLKWTKFYENEVENFIENKSKFAKILKENERISFVHFCEFRSTKISIETLPDI